MSRRDRILRRDDNRQFLRRRRRKDKEIGKPLPFQRAGNARRGVVRSVKELRSSARASETHDQIDRVNYLNPEAQKDNYLSGRAALLGKIRRDRRSNRLPTRLKIDSERKRVLFSRVRSPFTLAVLVFVLLVALVFIVGPLIARHFEAGSAPTTPTDPRNEDPNALTSRFYKAGEECRVNVAAAWVLETPDVQGERLTQLLYNTKVQVTRSGGVNGFVEINLDPYGLARSPGLRGYVLPQNLVAASSGSAELDDIPDDVKERLIITDRTKRVTTDARSGNTVVNAGLGTTLYSNYRANGLARVYLPDGQYGWVAEPGILALEKHADVYLGTAQGFANYARSFLSCMFLPNGLTASGIDMNGVVNVSAQVAGLTLPRRPLLVLESTPQIWNALMYEGSYEADSFTAAERTALRASSDSGSKTGARLVAAGAMRYPGRLGSSLEGQPILAAADRELANIANWRLNYAALEPGDLIFWHRPGRVEHLDPLAEAADTDGEGDSEGAEDSAGVGDSEETGGSGKSGDSAGSGDSGEPGNSASTGDSETPSTPQVKADGRKIQMAIYLPGGQLLIENLVYSEIRLVEARSFLDGKIIYAVTRPFPNSDSKE